MMTLAVTVIQSVKCPRMNEPSVLYCCEKCPAYRGMTYENGGAAVMCARDEHRPLSSRAAELNSGIVTYPWDEQAPEGDGQQAGNQLTGDKR